MRSLCCFSRGETHCTGFTARPVLLSAPAGYRGHVWKDWSLHGGGMWGVRLCCSLKSNCAGRLGGMPHPALWSQEKGAHTEAHTHVVQEALTEKQPSLSYPRLQSDTYPYLVCPWAIGMPHAAALLCFISGVKLGFRTPYLKGCIRGQSSSLLLEEESLTTLCLVLCPRKTTSWLHRCLELMVKDSKKQ